MWFLLIFEAKMKPSWRKIFIRIQDKIEIVEFTKTLKKTEGFLMILKVQGSHCSKKMLSKFDKKVRSQPDMHGWWILDGFLIDFGGILESKIDQKSIRQGSWKAMWRMMQADRPKKRQPEALTTIRPLGFWPGKGVGGRVNPPQKGWKQTTRL